MNNTPTDHQLNVSLSNAWEAEAIKAKQFTKFLDDMCAFITFGYEHDKSAEWILGNVAHDLHGIHREGFDGCFSPRSTGFASKL